MLPHPDNPNTQERYEKRPLQWISYISVTILKLHRKVESKALKN